MTLCAPPRAESARRMPIPFVWPQDSTPSPTCVPAYRAASAAFPHLFNPPLARLFLVSASRPPSAPRMASRVTCAPATRTTCSAAPRTKLWGQRMTRVAPAMVERALPATRVATARVSTCSRTYAPTTSSAVFKVPLLLSVLQQMGSATTRRTVPPER